LVKYQNDRLTHAKRFTALLGGSGFAKHHSGLRPLRYFAQPKFASPANVKAG